MRVLPETVGRACWDGPVSTYRLRGGAPVADVPVLDAAQRRVVEHAGGPLLVLAGPGTGKTTTLVEAAVARVEAGVPVEQILMLTFSRRAAGELRDRVTARLGRTVREPIARTLHSYAFGVLRMANLAQGAARRRGCCPAPSRTSPSASWSQARGRRAGRSNCARRCAPARSPASCVTC